MFKQRNIKWAAHQRRWFGKWHLYIGILAGTILAITGITGSILVFRDEIDAKLNPALFSVEAGQKKIPVGDIIPVVQQKYPGLAFNFIDCEDTSANATYQLYDFKNEEQIFINPYTGEKVGKRMYESSFISIVTQLHTSLFIPVVGRYIIGLAALCMLILIISGIRLWLPKTVKQLKAALTINFKAGIKRQNYDWHKILGLYTSPATGLIALTGTCITFSIIIIPLLFILTGKSPKGVAQLLNAKSSYTAGIKPMPISKAISIASTIFPQGYVTNISLPSGAEGNIRLDIKCKGLPKSGKRELLILDQYSGKVLTNSHTDFPDIGHGYLTWLAPIHYGSFGGRPTQFVALLAGFVPAALLITGLYIWWPRFKRGSKKAHQPPAPVVTVNSIPAWRCFIQQLGKGLYYAMWFLVLATACGGLYGLPASAVLPSAIFSVSFITVLIVLNGAVALLSFLFNVLILFPFGKSSRRIIRYFALSSAFCIVFLAAWWLLQLQGHNWFA
jgi:uncharacterized iron-regulated membrane protein